MNRIEISNMALNAIGARPIASLTDESSMEAKTMALLYKPNMEEVLSMHAWPSATARIRISEVNTENLSSWPHKYQLPNDCVTVLTMLTAEDFMEIDRIEVRDIPVLSSMPIFQREGDILYAQPYPGIIKYIYYPQDADQLRDILGEAVAMRLAYKAAIRLGRDAQLYNQLDVRFNDTFLRARMAENTDRRGDFRVKKNWAQWRNSGASRRDDFLPRNIQS